MDHRICGHCGAEIPNGDGGECLVCKGSAGRKISKRRWYWPVGIILLLMVGSFFILVHGEAWDFSWDALTGKPVAVINGDPVSRQEFRERLAVGRIVLERQYEKDIFDGERGRALLAELERDVLEKMLEDRLVTQEVRRLNVRVSDERVRQEMEAIGREIYGSWKKCQATLKDDGIPPEHLFNHIRNHMLRQEVAKVKTPSGADVDESFGAWLVQARCDAGITVYQAFGSSQSPSRGGSTCCVSCGDGCGGCGPSTGVVDPALKSKASAAVLAEYHKTNPAGQGGETRVTDYGCHARVDIVQGDKVVRSYIYKDGKAFEN